MAASGRNLGAKSPRAAPLLDEATIAAVEILNEAIKDTRVPGVNDFMVVTSALQRVIDDRRPGDLAVAGAAFDQLDGRVRAGIAEKAIDRAEDHRAALAHRPPPPVLPGLPSVRSTATASPKAPPAAPKQPATRQPQTAKPPAANGAPLISAMAGLLRGRG